MEECGQTVGAVFEDRAGKSGDASNPCTLCSNHGIKPRGTQLTGQDAI